MFQLQRCLRRAGQTRKCAFMGLAALIILSGIIDGGITGRAKAAQSETSRVRIGISRGTWGGVNANDAMAAIRAWTKIILGQRGITVDVETKILGSVVDMSDSLKNGLVEAASLVTSEFLALDPKFKPDSVFLAFRNEAYTEKYVILAHQGSGIRDLHDLQGRQVLIHQGPRTGLAPQWFESLMANRLMDAADGTSVKTKTEENPSKAVLQVFFRKADASVVSANAFNTASELNPQLRRELRILASSPEVIPIVFFFRAGYVSDIRDKLEAAITALHETPAGQQVLTVFQCDRIEKRSVSHLEPTRRMLAEIDLQNRRRNSGEPQTP